MLPAQVQSEVDVQSILVRARPFHDAEELLPVCYRCSTTNPLLNTQVRSAHLCMHPHCEVPGFPCCYKLSMGACPRQWNRVWLLLPCPWLLGACNPGFINEGPCCAYSQRPFSNSLLLTLNFCPQGDYCINCGAPFIRSFVTFEHLPLVSV